MKTLVHVSQLVYIFCFDVVPVLMLMEGYLLKNSGGKKNPFGSLASGSRRSSFGNAFSRWERR